MNESLEELLRRLEGTSYGTYGSLRGRRFDQGSYALQFRHIQGSKGADPASVVRLSLGLADLDLPAWAVRSSEARLATGDYLLRAFGQAVTVGSRGNRGEEGSGSFQPLKMPQQILERNVVTWTAAAVEMDFRISLPGGGSPPSVLGTEAAAMFEEELPAIVDFMMSRVRKTEALRAHCHAVEDAEALRSQLPKLGLVVFVADGARLPRESGVSDLPATGPGVVAFKAPPELAVEVVLPHSGRILGMGIKLGVTIIVGGGFHGKSTLLNALGKAVYPHIPGDGREQIVASAGACCVRAEEGRSVQGVNIGSFVRDLPSGQSTEWFCTENASGSTSQAAAVVEAVSAGADLLLLDEDSSATNFLIRDDVMRALVPEDPIVPLMDRVKELHEGFDVSTILVVGGSSAYFAVADSVIGMRFYEPVDLTEEAAALAPAPPGGELEPAVVVDLRKLTGDNFDPSFQVVRLAKKLERRIKPLRGEPRILEYGDDRLDLRGLAGLVDEGQVEAIGWCLLESRDYLREEELSPSALAKRVTKKITAEGVGIVAGDSPVFLSRPRKLELAGAINRLRSLRVEPIEA